MTIKSPDRRQFVKVAVGSFAAIPLIVYAQTENQKLAEDDPTAVSLGYKEKSTEVDAEKYPAHEATQLCGGCSLYSGAEEPWGGCVIFPGKQVAAVGWCAAFAASPS